MSASRPLSEVACRALRAQDGRVYTLVERIGSGASGAVYRARDDRPELPREVCIKRLATAVDPELARGLLEEARLLASVRHANVVSLLGVGEEDSGLPFLVLELVSGADLRALSRSLLGSLDAPGSLPWRLAVHVACALLRALGAVQRALPGLVHRDVTPHNVLISTEGEVKLADFGIALTRERARWLSPAVVCGKVGYMAPEQIRGERLDVRTDLFAVGVVLYELLAGVRPARAYGRGDEVAATEAGRLAPLGPRRPDLDPALVAVVDRLIAWRAKDRYESPDRALRELAVHGAGELGSLRMAALTCRFLSARAGDRAGVERPGISAAKTRAAKTREEVPGRARAAKAASRPGGRLGGRREE